MDLTRLITRHLFEPFREARWLVGGGDIASRAWCTGSAAGAGMRAFHGWSWMVLADPSGVHRREGTPSLLHVSPGRRRVIESNFPAIKPSQSLAFGSNGQLSSPGPYSQALITSQYSCSLIISVNGLRRPHYQQCSTGRHPERWTQQSATSLVHGAVQLCLVKVTGASLLVPRELEGKRAEHDDWRPRAPGSRMLITRTAPRQPG